MLLLLMSIKVMMRDDEVQISKRSVMILIKSECWWLCREKREKTVTDESKWKTCRSPFQLSQQKALYVYRSFTILFNFHKAYGSCIIAPELSLLGQLWCAITPSGHWPEVQNIFVQYSANCIVVQFSAIICNAMQLCAITSRERRLRPRFHIFLQFLMYFDVLFPMHSTWTSHVQLLVTKACWLKNGHELFLKLGWKMPQNHNCHFSFT